MTSHHSHFIIKISAAAVLLGSIMTSPVSSLAVGKVTVGGPFTLTDPDGRKVTEQTYKGKWTLVYFGYTACPDSCPLALMVIATALKKLGSDAGKLQAIFITLDPERDTTEVLREYTESFDPRIIGLTGSQSDIDAAAHAYGAYYVRHRGGPEAQHDLVDHSTYIYLMNPQGVFVRAFDASTSGDAVASFVGSELSLQDNPTHNAAQIK